MQNDLISRSALRQEVLDKMPQGGARGVFLAFIDEQPTAYNLEKVVKQLESETDCPNCSMYCADANMCGFDEMRKQAINIVLDGGIE